MNSWGVLGNPTKEEIEKWKNLPHGAFKNMIKNLKGAQRKDYTIQVTKYPEEFEIGFVRVKAFSHEQAVQEAKDLIYSGAELEWVKHKRTNSELYNFRVSQIHS